MNRRLNHYPVMLAMLAIGGCASGSTGPPTEPSDPWAAVMALDHGTEIIVIVVSSDRVDSALSEGATIVDGGYRLVGTLAEVNAGGILVRPESSLAEPSAVPRQAIARLFVREPPSITRGVAALIGGAAGIAVCTFGGLYRVSDATANRVAWSLICVSGGAGIGYLANVDPATLRLVYERPEASG